MTASDLASLLPMMAIAATAILLLLFAAFRRLHQAAFLVTLAGLFLSILAFGFLDITHAQEVTSMLIYDSSSIWFMLLILLAGNMVVILSDGYFRRTEASGAEEFCILLLCATLGALVMAASSHFVSFFLGLEILSVSLYSLIAFPRGRSFCIEAAIKYFILAAMSSAFLLFGMALIYGELGTMDFAAMAASTAKPNAIVLAGMALSLVGIGFKLAVVPFHWWTPDVYEGAPAPVTAFIATISKGAMFAVLLRYVSASALEAHPSVRTALVLIAIASMFAGNVLGLLQNNVKRILAYSSIAHLGYLLVAYLSSYDPNSAQIGSSDPKSLAAVYFYLAAYVVSALGAFGVISAMTTREREAYSIEDYRGLFWRHPWMAAVFTIMLLSLAGLPLTAGFIGKFYILMAGAQASNWMLAFTLVVTSTIGLFYYLRIIVVMGLPAREGEEGAPGWTPGVELIALAALVLAVVWMGVFPQPVLGALHKIAILASFSF